MKDGFELRSFHVVILMVGAGLVLIWLPELVAAKMLRLELTNHGILWWLGRILTLLIGVLIGIGWALGMIMHQMRDFEEVSSEEFRRVKATETVVMSGFLGMSMLAVVRVLIKRGVLLMRVQSFFGWGISMVLWVAIGIMLVLSDLLWLMLLTLFDRG